MKYKKLWLSLLFINVTSFAVLGYFGREIYRKAPPIPARVVTTEGEVVFTGANIRDGQNVWQSIGGQEVGSVWGHGAYVAPDWTADWLHREAVFMLDELAQAEYKTNYDELKPEQQALLRVRLQKDIRVNGYSKDKDVIVISASRARAIRNNAEYYKGLFMQNPARAAEREAYAIPAGTVKDAGRMAKMNAFFFWASWACVTLRPNGETTYTNNWPQDDLVGNHPAGSLVFWTGFSVILLLVGIALLAFYYATHHEDEPTPDELPKADPFLKLDPTPSMLATYKYFWVVTALILFQVVLGGILAHYGVEGNGFYGIPLADYLPYAVARTWHVQLSILWIATSWLATGLYIAPAISGVEPKFQRAGVTILFLCLLVIVVGSMIGQWFGIMQKLDLVTNFWFGHQGYEYVDLGRFWQGFLFIGLILWLTLMVRAVIPALRTQAENRHLLALFLISSAAIALFYGAGLMWDRQTNLAIAEYWRWWVVHLWVEGFFEVFATVVIAFLFVKLGLLKVHRATLGVLFSTAVFLTGGILGTFHHIYFSGTPTGVLAVGASFSALEVVPLVLIGFEAFHNYRLSKAADWVVTYKWPIYFFIAVAFWNLLGAGVFGFLINPPIALYYMQGLNTTPVHSHTALYGVYGTLGIGLMLFVFRTAMRSEWNETVLKYSFWAINVGLLLMVMLSVLPVGVAQTLASVEKGMWYARSMEFMQQDYIETLIWMRAIGDTIFAAGIVGLAYFLAGLTFGWSLKK